MGSFIYTMIIDDPFIKSMPQVLECQLGNWRVGTPTECSQFPVPPNISYRKVGNWDIYQSWNISSTASGN